MRGVVIFGLLDSPPSIFLISSWMQEIAVPAE